MRVLFINPYVSPKQVYGHLAPFSPFLPPLGICYLASFLEKYGHTVEILDLRVEKNVMIADYVKRRQFDVIGVTATTVEFFSAQKVLREIKEKYPFITTVLGGAHMSATQKASLEECQYIDIGVVGEGEQTMRDLLDILAIDGDLAQCRGIIYRHSGKIIQNPLRAYIENLDLLPIPNRHFLKKRSHYYHHFLRGGGTTASLITSRGCMCQCAFCTQAVFGTRVRSHSPAYVLDEISKLKKDYGVDFFSFEDDIFNFSHERVSNICEALLHKNIKIQWGCSIRIDLLHEKDVILLKKAGAKKIYIGLETFTPRIQEMINKRFDAEMVEEKLHLLKKYDLSVNASFMLGFPTETVREIKMTIEKACRLPIAGAFFCAYTPYPGTPLYSIAQEHGKISDSWDDFSNHPGTLAFASETCSARIVHRLLYRAYVRFYAHLFLSRPVQSVKKILIFAWVKYLKPLL